MADREFPYEYGSDLHWLWGWGARIEARLLSEHPINEYDRMNFRPDRLATDSLMRFSVRFGQIVELINVAQQFCERSYVAFRQDGTEAARDNLADSMGVLMERIFEGAKVIAANMPGDAAAKVQKPERLYVDRSNGEPFGVFDGQPFVLSADGLLYLDALINARGRGLVSGPKLGITHVSRARKGWPQELLDAIEVTDGGGSRLTIYDE